ncbi:MAG: hypothetical protein H6765_04965 [Candidatus Peribacteria bacterium]|nr:MAG: hypothetical protein H6765_04965 [Candidatus Peribacteria bacterium]
MYEHPELTADQWNFDALYAQAQVNKEKIAATTRDEYFEELLGPRRLAKELRELM